MNPARADVAVAKLLVSVALHGGEPHILVASNSQLLSLGIE